MIRAIASSRSRAPDREARWDFQTPAAREPSLFGVHADSDVFSDLLVEMELQLVVELIAGPAAQKKHSALHEELVWPAHDLRLLHDQIDGFGEPRPVGGFGVELRAAGCGE